MMLTPHNLSSLPLRQVVVDDGFWSPEARSLAAGDLRDASTKFEKDGALANFDRSRDGEPAEHAGPPWFDGLVYEMIRAASDFLAAAPDPELDGTARRLHRAHRRGAGRDRRRLPEHLPAAQEPRPPLGTGTAATSTGSTTSTTRARWSRRRSTHCLATGKTSLLPVAVRLRQPHVAT